MERLIRYPIFILGLALLGACSDQSTEPPELVTTCLECHRSEGGAAIPGWPPLTELSRDEISAKLSGYRDGGNPDSRMTDVAHDFSDEEIRQLADFYGGN